MHLLLFRLLLCLSACHGFYHAPRVRFVVVENPHLPPRRIFSSPFSHLHNQRTQSLSQHTLSSHKQQSQHSDHHQPRRQRRRRWWLLSSAAAVALVTILWPLRSASAAAADLVQTAAIVPAATATVLPPPPPLLPAPTISEAKLVFRLFFASLVGAALGKERGSKQQQHPAGVRTMSLVALGAACFTVCSLYGFNVGQQRYDPSRMAANVASGVGFVGAGVITTTTTKNGERQETLVHGLTTAAAIWLAASVGVASAVGLYWVSSAGAALAIFILKFGRTSPVVRIKNAAKAATRRRSGTIGTDTKEEQQQQPQEEHLHHTSLLEHMPFSSGPKLHNITDGALEFDDQDAVVVHRKSSDRGYNETASYEYSN